MTRRQFLRTLALGAVGLAVAPEIAKATARPSHAVLEYNRILDDLVRAQRMFRENALLTCNVPMWISHDGVWENGRCLTVRVIDPEDFYKKG